MLFITSRILVVDMLTNRLPIHLVSGIIVQRAHRSVAMKYLVLYASEKSSLLLGKSLTCWSGKGQKSYFQQRHSTSGLTSFLKEEGLSCLQHLKGHLSKCLPHKTKLNCRGINCIASATQLHTSLSTYLF